ncbi:AraC family transcriptional regulator [Corallococcus silvisoli]|uniref:AraC family transcriptional regulator n=1 Tax=Corallococcus silvisoli TaxID=2697031 RepID=UPI0013785F00|nr:AraC family transcriptional regulator [Corallococcus silvisoli]NBD11674.1 helix-turn-helix domain-containing protein [Corallococcus silvisoli]
MDERDVWRSVDPLGEALHLLRMSGAFYCSSEFSAPWGLALPAMPQCLMFHVVTAGQAWLEVEGRDSVLLQPGDLALVPQGTGHRLVSDPGTTAAPLFELPREAVSERYEILRHGGTGAVTKMVCGAVRFDHPTARHFVSLLPRIIRVAASQAPNPEWLHSTLRFMAAEAEALRPGGETVVTRLADILVIQAIRAWLEHDPEARTGWLGALQDRQVGRAIVLIHRDPARAWTLGTLAKEAAMSRSAFAARFTQRVGMPAMQYLVHWRMQVAASLLREEDAGLADVASRLGYQSEAAFSRAFKRCIGVAPGTFRRDVAPLPAPDSRH